MLLHVLQLAALNVTSTTAHTVLYTVPAGFRVVLRHVTLANRSATGGSAYLFAPDPFEVHRVTLAARSAAGDTADYETWIVLGPGDKIAAIVGTGVQADYVVSGSIYFI